MDLKLFIRGLLYSNFEPLILLKFVAEILKNFRSCKLIPLKFNLRLGKLHSYKIAQLIVFRSKIFLDFLYPFP